MKKRKIRIRILAGVLLVLVLFFALVEFFTNLLWFKELGYVNVFFKELVTQLEFGIPTFLIVTLICYFYLMAIKKHYYTRLGACSRVSP